MRESERMSGTSQKVKKAHTENALKKKEIKREFFSSCLGVCLLHITTISKKRHIYREWARDSSCAAAACMAYSVFHKNSWMIDVCRWIGENFSPKESFCMLAKKVHIRKFQSISSSEWIKFFPHTFRFRISLSLIVSTLIRKLEDTQTESEKKIDTPGLFVIVLNLHYRHLRPTRSRGVD